MAIVTLTTDFATRDHYVAAMKGVILCRAPGVSLVDVTHDIARHDIAGGAFVIRQAFHWFPAGTIHLAVIDPGVGGPRRLVAARYADHFFVTPDNGLLSYIDRDFVRQAAHAISRPEWLPPDASATFHGRDILAPAAAHLAMGGTLADFGPPVHEIRLLDCTNARALADGTISGCVIHVDHFGNLVTNIRAGDLNGNQAEVHMCGRTIGTLRRTYSDVASGDLLAMIGSSAYLEIAVNGGSAAATLNVARGERVFVRTMKPDGQ